MKPSLFSVLWLSCVFSACVERRLIITTEPPGAEVFLDGRRLGTTPYEGLLDSYGHRRLQLRHSEYAVLVEELEWPAPWSSWLFFDFFTEVLWPGTIQEEVREHRTLIPKELPSWDEVKQKAQALEEQMDHHVKEQADWSP